MPKLLKPVCDKTELRVRNVLPAHEPLGLIEVRMDHDG